MFSNSLPIASSSRYPPSLTAVLSPEKYHPDTRARKINYGLDAFNWGINLPIGLFTFLSPWVEKKALWKYLPQHLQGTRLVRQVAKSPLNAGLSVIALSSSTVLFYAIQTCSEHLSAH